jgi:hypothetical protein
MRGVGVEYLDASQPGYELGSRRILVNSCRIIARKEIGCAKKTSCVI